MSRSPYPFLVLALLVSFLITSCGGGDGSAGGSGKLNLNITDAPIDGAYEVVVSFSGLTIKPAEGPAIDIFFEDPDGNPEITILKIIIPPKAKLPLHKHPEINAGVLLKGELTVISETNDTLHLKAGEPIVELVNTWHFGLNDGAEPVEIIVFYAGITETPITVLKNKN